jgi:hypothetical protein
MDDRYFVSRTFFQWRNVFACKADVRTATDDLCQRREVAGDDANNTLNERFSLNRSVLWPNFLAVADSHAPYQRMMHARAQNQAGDWWGEAEARNWRGLRVRM